MLVEADVTLYPDL